MFDLLIPPQIDTVLIYPKPVSMRWRATKLRSFCADTLGSEPQPDTAFLFTNKKQDTLLLYLVCENGDQTLTKKLDRGAFMVPTAKPGGAPFVSMRRAALSRLFRF
ncbi:MAG: IS66 family insertion sequence element accessory protein TnpB [Myxococcales bacterium]|nr:IS66 family insertion sequence element accessory protein TnpB [Myxococcales bacterium]